MSAASALARGRALAQSLMVDACLIERVTGQTTDDLTGVVTPTYATTYTGVCKVQTSGSGAMGDRADVGEVAQVVLRIELQLPVVGSEAVRRGQRATITACVHDAAPVGRTFLIRDEQHKSFATARRLQVEETT